MSRDTAGLDRYNQLARMSPTQRAKLVEAGELDPHSTFRRKGRHQMPETPTKRHPKPTGPDSATVELICKRALRRVDGHGTVLCCEVHGAEEPLTGERGWQWSIHHIRGRDGVRTDNSPCNLILVSGRDNVTGCHGRIHKDRTWAREHGLWLPRNYLHVPASHNPVLIENESRWVYLSAAGGYADDPPDGVQ